jgi:hypothetical protein
MRHAKLATQLVFGILIVGCSGSTPPGGGGGGSGGTPSTGAGGNSFGGSGGSGGAQTPSGGVGGGAMAGTGDAGGVGGFTGGTGGNATAGFNGSTGGITCPSQSPASNLFLPATPIDYPTDSNPESLAIGDLDGDGVSDVVIGGFLKPPPPPVNQGAGGYNGAGGMSGVSNGSVVVALANKAGGFKTGVRYNGVAPSFLGFADVNGDKHPDVVAVSYAGPSVLLNTGAGALGAATTYVVPNVVSGFASGDLDGDGKDEMLFATNPNVVGGEGGLTVLWSAGGSAFSSQTWDKGFNPSAIAVGELNGMVAPDGGLDTVVAGSNGVHIFLDKGFGSTDPSITSDHLWTVALADIDGDGHQDIVGNDGLGYVVLLNINFTYGGFAVPRRLPLGDGLGGTARFGDVDGDGKVDAVIWREHCGTLAVYLNDGNGSFGAPSYIPDASQTGTFELGDVNGDKRLDIVFTKATSVGVRLNRAP